MKKHLVNISYEFIGGTFIYNGLVDEVIGDNGKVIVYPYGIFKKVFGFSLPVGSKITMR